jgi:hypothetical protein
MFNSQMDSLVVKYDETIDNNISSSTLRRAYG